MRSRTEVRQSGGHSVAHGPLGGLRVIEVASVGPGPHAAMMLADLGASVIRLSRDGEGAPETSGNQSLRGRVHAKLDLKAEGGAASLLSLVQHADVLIEGNRPGVMERLGVGPDVCLARNPALVYARMTGWGQDGPLSSDAGHDINYVALTGALHAMGRPNQPPVPPLNLVGDFGGGSMLLLAGVMAALLERTMSGRGQVVDVAMVDGVSSLMQMIWSARHEGWWSDERGDNILDGGAPYYASYECGDGKFVAVGAIEPQFYSELLAGLDLGDEDVSRQSEKSEWPRMRKLVAKRFLSRDRDDWITHFAGRDACVTPVLDFDEAMQHPHLRARNTLTSVDGVPQAAPSPRFSRTPAQLSSHAAAGPRDVDELVRQWSSPRAGRGGWVRHG